MFTLLCQRCLKPIDPMDQDHLAACCLATLWSFQEQVEQGGALWLILSALEQDPPTLT